MSGVAPEQDLLARTFDALRERGLEMLRQRVGSYRFQSLLRSDVVPNIIDVQAWMHEQSAFYYLRKCLNSLLITADLREAMALLTRAQGYRMRPATSAAVPIKLAPNPPHNVAITIPSGTRIAVGSLTFEFVREVVIPAGATVWPDTSTDDIPVVTEGATKTETFTSDGTVFQKFELALPGVIDGSVSVKVDSSIWEETPSLVFVEGTGNGRDVFVGDGTDGQEIELSLLHAIIAPEDEDSLVVLVTRSGYPSSAARTWQQVSAFSGAPEEYTASQATDGVTTIRFGASINDSAPRAGDTIDVFYTVSGSQRRYQLTFDQDDRPTIMFGDGLLGNVPQIGASIEVSYRIGGGSKGNVAAHTIEMTVSGFLPSGTRTTVLIVNDEPGDGGGPQETIEHARFYAPKAVRSNERAVRKNDWTALASTFADPVYGSPSHAAAYLKQRVPESNVVRVALWGRDESGAVVPAGIGLRYAIKKYLDTVRTLTTVCEVVPGRVVTLDISASIELAVGQVQQTVFSAIRAAVENFFRSTFVRPGLDLSISKLYCLFQHVSGVTRSEITSIVGSTFTELELGSGDGSTTSFSGDFVIGDGMSLVPGSVLVRSESQQLVDDESGGFGGDVGTGTCTVDYDTGKFSVDFESAPTLGSRVYAEGKVRAWFSHGEVLPASDGTVQALNDTTDYYPIVKRTPVGMWSGDMVRVIDGFQVGSGTTMRGYLPSGVITSTLFIDDSSGTPQSLRDSGYGRIIEIGTGNDCGQINYETGLLSFDFPAVPTVPIRARWHTKTVDVIVPIERLPLQPGRVFVWGGYHAGPVQTGDLRAADDGEGNIFGDVLDGGAVTYDTGRVKFEWSGVPNPGYGGGASYAVALSPLPDGIQRSFTFDVATDLSVNGTGRLRFQFSDLSGSGTVIQDAYDNANGRIHGESLDTEERSTISYYDGTGTVTFAVAPVAGSGTFLLQITNTAIVLYAGWSYRVKTPVVPGLDKCLFADSNGRLWGISTIGSVNPFPTDRLDHASGRYNAVFEGSPIAEGREQLLSYDAMIGLPPALDVKIASDEVATLGKISLTEVLPEPI